MTAVLTVVQCWDDGVTTDARLVDILRRHQATASFNLNAGLHGKQRTPAGIHQGTPVERLAWNEMKAVYAGFTIANHSLTHPHLDQISIDAARDEIVRGRHCLQQFFGQPVRGFAYPYGTYSDAVMQLVRDAGHAYARTVGNADDPFPPRDAMATDPCCHFLASDFWSRYERAKQRGVFYFWGHSYELVSESMWREFEAAVERIGADPQARWGDLEELFAGP